MKPSDMILFGSLVLLSLGVRMSLGQFRSPEITEHPADLLVSRNEPATLNCHADGRPKPSISWFKNGKPFRISKEGGRHVLLGNGDLFFLRVLQTKKDDDSGLYWCQASNSVGTVRSKNATLEIAVLKEDFIASPEDARVAEGETALLKCVPPRGHPEPVVSWTKDSVEVDPATQYRFKIVDKGSLVITGVRVSDSGEYVCKARNVYGSKESKPANLSVLVPPHMVSASGEVTGTAGSTVELVCRVVGDPPPEVFWERASPQLELPIERMAQEENGQVLRIRHASLEDQGIYTCRAENPVGSVRANTSLVIHSRPVIKVSPVEARVGINGSVSFKCMTSGNPQPTTYWTHEGTGVVVGTGQAWGEGRVYVDAENTLTIRRVLKEDQGYYVCSAVGVAGSALDRAHLEVQSVTDMPPPLIALGAPNQTLPLNTEGEMPCEARGTPEPHVVWFAGEDPFRPSKRAFVSPSGTLRITGLKTSDTGMYTCKAISESGTTEWTTSLIVANPSNPNVAFFKMPSDTALPEPPAQVTVLSINATSVTLGWRRGRPGSSSILSYAVQLWSPDIRGPWVTASTKPTPLSVMPVGVIVTGLLPNVRYVFVARASNHHGLSRPSDITPMVRTLAADAHEILTLHEIRARLAVPSIRLLNAQGASPSSIKVSWLLLVDASIIEGIYVRYRSVGASSGVLSVETVYFHKTPGAPPDSYVVTGLRPDTQYEIFVTPFYDNVEGQPSAAIRTVTLESRPEASPANLHQFFVNATAAQVMWEAIPPPLSNGVITGYILEVVDVSEGRRALWNSTVRNTSTVIGGLTPGSSYHVTVRGMTSGGVGPVSVPLTFTLPLVKTKETSPPTSLEFPAVTFETNYILIVGIASASVVVFMLLFASVFYIYRHRRKNKSPPYFCKDESKDTWCDYPECWNDSCKSMSVGTTSTNRVSRTNPVTTSASRQAFPKSNSQQYFKGNCDTFDPCSKSRTPEDLYEDPDGLRLVSFTKYSAKRCFSPEPYATTPLIATEGQHLKGSLQPLKNLPPNIPLKGTLPRGIKSEDFCSNLNASDLVGGGHLKYNYNPSLDKEITGGPILQFPPPPPSEENYSDKGGAAPFKNESFTRFLQQQLPYSLGGSSSGGSQQSHGSPHFGPRAPRTNVRGTPPPPLLVSSYKLPPEHDYESRILVEHQPIILDRGGEIHPQGGALLPCIKAGSVPLDSPKENGCIHHSHPHQKEESEGDCYSQPHNAAIDSPNSSVVGDAEESESDVYSSGSCCSSNLPLAHSHELNFVESLRAASEARWGRGDSVCSTDDSCYGGGGIVAPGQSQQVAVGGGRTNAMRPLQPHSHKKPPHPSGAQIHEHRFDAPNIVSESISSPLI